MGQGFRQAWGAKRLCPGYGTFRRRQGHLRVDDNQTIEGQLDEYVRPQDAPVVVDVRLLDEVAQLAGLPGKIGLSGDSVSREYLAGGIAKIREYCEVDCANTYLLWLRFQQMRGASTAEHYARECAILRDWIAAQSAPSWREFLERWKSA